MATTPPPSPSCSPATCSAYNVLCDTFLLRHVTSFQCGFPPDIVEWKRANESMRSPWGSPQNVLSNLAVQTNNLRMLERLYRYYKEQPAYYDSIPNMSFKYIWRLALKCGNISMAEWIDGNDPTLSHRDDDRDVQETIECALGSPGMEMTKWLLGRRPQYKKLGHLFDLYEVAATGKIELYQWLMDNVEGIEMTPEQMDVAAKEGHLDMVRYLHEHSPAGCTSSAMDDAADHGHLEIVTFLHEHRTEGCTTDAMNFAAGEGYLDVVRFLHGHRTEGCTTYAMNSAARHGHLEIVRFLHENRKEGATSHAMTGAVSKRHTEIVTFLQQNRSEGCEERAIQSAAENRDLEMVRFLHEQYPEHSVERALYTATGIGQLDTDRGQLDIVQYIVENTTQGCVFHCLQNAKKSGRAQMEAYLSGTVDPLIQKCSPVSHKREDAKRVCQKKE